LKICVPGIKFGVAFCEASGPCLIRHQGNDSELETLATDYANKIGAGHSLVILMKNAYPLYVLPRLKDVPEVVNVYCATANAIEVIIAESDLGKGILGVIDGLKPKGIEKERDVEERMKFLRNIGYKF